MKNIQSFETFNEAKKVSTTVLTIKPLYYISSDKKRVVFRIVDDLNTIENLEKSLKDIDKLLAKAETNKAIDKDDLAQERRNCANALKKLRKEKESNEYEVFDIKGVSLKDGKAKFTKAGEDFEIEIADKEMTKEQKMKAIVKEIKNVYNKLEIKPIDEAATTISKVATLVPYSYYNWGKEINVFVDKDNMHPDPSKKMIWAWDEDGGNVSDFKNKFTKAGKPIQVAYEVSSRMTANQEKTEKFDAIKSYIASLKK